MSEEITASYMIDAAAFNPAFKWHLHRLTRWKWLVLFVISIGIPGYLFMFTPWHGIGDIVMLLVMPVLIAIGAIIWYVFMVQVFRLSRKLQVKRLPTYGLTLNIRITEAGMKCSAGEAESFFPWNMVVRSTTTPDGALIYRQTNLFEWLPKTAFTSEADYNRFLYLLAAKTKHTKLS